MGPRLRRIPLRHVRWERYDVVKALFHQGWETLERYKATRHPFIITKLGSVVAEQDREGILFHGRNRRRLFETQRRIDAGSRYITLLSEPARDLWQASFGSRDNLLLVPGAVDDEIPDAGADPYPADNRARCLFAGNIYTPRTQLNANRVLIDKLNSLGRALDRQGVRLYLLGIGDIRQLDDRYVTYLGHVPYAASWDYLHHADVGLLLSAAAFMHNNESTKIYHYLRAGLPVVSETGFPNDHVLRDSNLAITAPSGDIRALATGVTQALHGKWDRTSAISFIRSNHTWACRAAVYEEILQTHFGSE